MTNRRNFIKGLTTAGIAAGAGALTAQALNPKPGIKIDDAPESSFERVMRTKTLRCGYASYTPIIKIDPNTRELSGLFYDITNLIGEQAGLKVEWAEEVGYGVIPQSLKAHRIDMFGGSVFPNVPRAQVSNFSTAAFFSTNWAYVRPNDTRFDNDLSVANQPNIKIAAADGDYIDAIAQADFPLAGRYVISELADSSEHLLAVVNGKADLTFMETNFANQFLRENPGSLKRIKMSKPLRVTGHTLMFDNDDWRMKLMLDTAFTELQDANVISKLVEKHTGRPDTYLPPALPYQLGA